jgi:hypothetical protein
MNTTNNTKIRCPYCGSLDVDDTAQTLYGSSIFRCSNSKCWKQTDVFPCEENSPEWFTSEECEKRGIKKLQKKVNNLNKELDKAYNELITYRKIIEGKQHE